MENVLTGLRSRRPLEAVDELALTFGVTPYAAAVRVAIAGLCGNDGLIWPQCDGLNWPRLRPIAG